MFSHGLHADEMALQPAPVFTDHMVLQRDRRVPVWGVAKPGTTITVTLGTARGTGVTDAQGAWRVEIGPLPVNAVPAVLSITSDHGERRDLQDVLVGDVWVGSGQSNMQLPCASFIGHPNDPFISTVPDHNLEALVNGAPYPKVRLFSTVMNNYAVPTANLRWVPATTESLKTFSAQFATMGVTLSQQLDVPVGLMLVAVGGSSASRWLTPQAIADDPACQQAVIKARATFDPAKEQATYQQALTKYESAQNAWNQLPEAEKKTKKAPGKPSPPVEPGVGLFTVGDFHDKILKPVIGYGIRGVLWDQGETGVFIRDIDQANVMGALIASWRKEWGQGDFPFVIVQKPSGGGCAFDPADPVYGWAADAFKPLPPASDAGGKNGREPSLRIAAGNPNVTLIPTSDLGGGLHPVNKFAYGARDARVILGAIYGRPGAWSGPSMASCTVEGAAIRVRFKQVGQGLVARQADAVQGFAIAGEDRKFVWATATIEGDAVVVSAPTVTKPLYVRYAWDVQIPWANLFNRDGFPALSFRTDP